MWHSKDLSWVLTVAYVPRPATSLNATLMHDAAINDNFNVRCIDYGRASCHRQQRMRPAEAGH
jgi:hypothetical protein